jgi:hypothetical protein
MLPQRPGLRARRPSNTGLRCRSLQAKQQYALPEALAGLIQGDARWLASPRAETGFDGVARAFLEDGSEAVLASSLYDVFPGRQKWQDMSIELGWRQGVAGGLPRITLNEVRLGVRGARVGSC